MRDPVTSSESSYRSAPDDRAALERVLAKVARHSEAIEQLLDLVAQLADSGVLAALHAGFEEFDENFSALTRPEFMGMVANLMMLLGVLSQISYEPFFTLAMTTPAAVNAAYPRARARRDGLSVREIISLARSPEVAGALEALLAVMRAQRPARGD